MNVDIVVVGAGVMGAASAAYLAMEGRKVLILDRFKPMNNRNASNDVSRVFRTYHADDRLKQKMAEMSRHGWKRLARMFPSKPFLSPVKVLWLESPPASSDGDPVRGCDSMFLRLGRIGMRQHFPKFTAEEAVVDTGGAILHASNATRNLLTLAKRCGARLITGVEVVGIDPGLVRLDDGTDISCSQTVITAGSWADKILGIDLGVIATRQEVVYFRPENEKEFYYWNFPIFGHMESGFYGFPINGTAAVKIANHHHGEEIDPDEPHSEASEEFVERCRNFFSEQIPSLASADIMKTWSCRYAVTPNNEFVIDRLDDKTVVATGFCGQGFKFAPTIGHLVTDLVLGQDPMFDLSRFKIR